MISHLKFSRDFSVCVCVCVWTCFESVCGLCVSASDSELSFTMLLLSLRALISGGELAIIFYSKHDSLSAPSSLKFISTVKAFTCLIITVSPSTVIVSTQEGVSEV